jgi:hypothetical protein
MDPRSPATPEILQQQLQLGQQMFAETIDARRVLGEIASVQKQLADAEQKVGDKNPALQATLAGAQSEVKKILIEGITQPQQGGLQSAYAALASALRVVEGGDRAVPSQAISVYKESSERVREGMAEWVAFKKTKLLQLSQKLSEGSFVPLAISNNEQE